jgi:hypothetical protein
MTIRTYQPGDEAAQARIFNEAASPLPAFKPATTEEIARRHAAPDFDPGARYYAVEDGQILGYAMFSPNGRVSYPWCLSGAEAAREPLLEAVLSGMKDRGIPAAWAAYRADWTPILEFLRGHGFLEKRQMINYVAEVAQLLPDTVLPPDRVVEPLSREEIRDLHALALEVVPEDDPGVFDRFYSENSYYDFSGRIVALKEAGGTRKLLGIALLVIADQFADPTQINAAMPCFRFGTFGTERERHKRVNGLFSTVFTDAIDGELLLGWLVRTQARPAGLTHIAAQAPSDAPAVCALYDRFFQRQGAFPILSRRLQD